MLKGLTVSKSRLVKLNKNNSLHSIYCKKNISASAYLSQVNEQIKLIFRIQMLVDLKESLILYNFQFIV